MRGCLIIDNYDSFTWNLQQYAAQQFAGETVVIKNDELSWQQLAKDLAQFAAVIISPGPGSPANRQDLGLSYQMVRQNQLPVLGVCLGFQALLHASGAAIELAPEPYHGRLSTVMHSGQDLVAGIKSPFKVVRYHSLCVRQPLPEDWRLIGQTADQIPMLISHQHLAKWGVQFHPESILTEHGRQIMANFQRLALRYQPPAARHTASVLVRQALAKTKVAVPQVSLIGRKLNLALTPQQVFEQLFAAAEYSFWLDSAAAQDKARFSFMGCVTAAEVYSFSLTKAADSLAQGKKFLQRLAGELNSLEVVTDLALPFAFRGGLVGCFSYEMKALFAGAAAHYNQHPDACWLKVTKFIAYDNLTHSFWVLALAVNQPAATAWLEDMVTKLKHLATAPPKAKISARVSNSTGGELEYLYSSLAKDKYIAAVEDCRQQIRLGNSYEIGLNRGYVLKAPAISDLQLYSRLRQANPAPYAAYLNFNTWQVFSSSPELFLRCEASGRVVSKPIKGTVARAVDPQQDRQAQQWLQNSEKNQAENLMIVDLVRNDLAQVCQLGTVQVSKLMQIESFATLHHLVSTVEGQLAADKDLIDVLSALYPAGSICGAPKIRTMQIIDRLEPTARGIFCGALGYLGYGKVAELNVAIRTLTKVKGVKLITGAGSAVTYLSDPAEEAAELELKMQAVVAQLF